MIGRRIPLISMVALVIAISGCTTEHEISEGEAVRLLTSRDAFKVDGEPFSGRVVYREDDKIKLTAKLKDGRPRGTLETFHDNGKRASSTELIWNEEERDSILDGEDIKWNEDGVMVQRRVAKRGEDRRLERWCENGERRETVTFEDGERRDRHEWDCESGKQTAAESFDEEGNPHGEHKAWAPDGTLIAHKLYTAGKADGLQQEWHANSTPSLKATFADGVATGQLERWNDQGKLVEAGTYGENGQKTGLWLEGYGEPRNVHYGPDGFVHPEISPGFVRAITTRPDTKAVEFWLKEGQVKVVDALPANYEGDAREGPATFPVQNWTYPVVVADASMLQLLVDHGADINQADSDGTTRLSRCAGKFSVTRDNYQRPCRPAELEQILALGGRGQVHDMKGRGPLHRIVDISEYEDRTWNRAHPAAREARVAAIHQLVKAGADPNVADAEGFTPLVYALKNRRVDLVRALLAAGAQASTDGPGGSKVVHWLFLNRPDRYSIDTEFVREALPLLVAAGADVNATMEWDGSQVSLRDLAARHAAVDLVELIDRA